MTNFKSKTLLIGIAVVTIFVNSCSSDDSATGTIINNIPNEFALISIENESKNVGLNPVLTWETSVDPDGDNVTYNVLLDTNVDPQTTIAENLSSTNFNISTALDLNTTYYWKVVAIDNENEERVSNIFSFKTTVLEPSESPINIEGIDAVFAQDIEYDIKERTKFDIFLPSSTTPTSLVIFIHGGGFKNGDKSKPYTATTNVDYPEELRAFLSNNIAFATINYTLLEDFGVETEGVLKCMNDSKRALQYIRSRADDFNIDKDKIALTGGSAGAGTSLWIATNDDMADTSNSDPVLRESNTR